jgi:hypothetical protein
LGDHKIQEKTHRSVEKMLTRYQIDSYNEQISQAILEKLKSTFEIQSHREEDWTGTYGDCAPAVHLWVTTTASFERVNQLVSAIAPHSRVFAHSTVEEKAIEDSKTLKYYQNAFSGICCALKPKDEVIAGSLS